jgi:MFS family permease
VNESSAPLESAELSTDSGIETSTPVSGGMWGISRTVWAVLLMLAYQNYALTIVGVAAPWIGKSFHLDDSGIARLFAWISVSSLGALVLSRMIDRLGRRRMVIWCLGAIPVCSLAAAMATTFAAFAAFQIALNAATSAGVSACIVMLAEELPIDQRANGQSLGGLAGAVGGGMCIMIIPLLVGYGISWRWMLVLAAAGVALIPAMVRMLPESERWEHMEALGITQKSRFYDVFHPLYRRRAVTLIVASLLTTVSQAAAQAFAYYHAVNDAKLSAGAASLMTVIGGGLGMVGFPLGAWFCERFGRVPTVVIFGFLWMAGQLWYYSAPAPPFIIPMLWLASSFCLITICDSAATVGTNAAITELFPTALRGTMMGWFAVTIAIGGVISNAGAAMLSHATGSLTSAISYIVLAGVPAVIVFAIMIDETRGMSLEAAAKEEDFRTARQ